VNAQFSGRVLVAEDAPTHLMLAKLLLEKMGLEVTTAKNGVEAVDKALNEQFDIIFMDIHMSNMDGYEATRALRNKGIETPVVALTADAMKGHDRQCMAAGCTDYIAKPIDRKQLVRVVQKYLGSAVGAAPEGKPAGGVGGPTTL
jgi:CheY-like chemotaxis protein